MKRINEKEKTFKITIKEKAERENEAKLKKY